MLQKSQSSHLLDFFGDEKALERKSHLNRHLTLLWEFSGRRGAEGEAKRRMAYFGERYGKTCYDACNLLYKTSLETV